jgi:hypothetical protein
MMVLQPTSVTAPEITLRLLTLGHSKADISNLAKVIPHTWNLCTVFLWGHLKRFKVAIPWSPHYQHFQCLDPHIIRLKLVMQCKVNILSTSNNRYLPTLGCNSTFWLTVVLMTTFVSQVLNPRFILPWH